MAQQGGHGQSGLREALVLMAPAAAVAATTQQRLTWKRKIVSGTVQLMLPSNTGPTKTLFALQKHDAPLGSGQSVPALLSSALAARNSPLHQPAARSCTAAGFPGCKLRPIKLRPKLDISGRK